MQPNLISIDFGCAPASMFANRISVDLQSATTDGRYKNRINQCLIPRQMNYASEWRKNKCAALLGCAKLIVGTAECALVAPCRRGASTTAIAFPIFEVPVTLVHHDHDDSSGINKIATARQALHDQVAARERAEHLFQEARTTIQTLETKLAHERIGRDEALRCLADELAVERTARQRAEKRLGEVLEERKEPSMVTSRGSAARTDPGDKMQSDRRRGRPPKIRPSEFGHCRMVDAGLA